MVVRRKPKPVSVEEFIQEGGAAPQVVESQTQAETKEQPAKDEVQSVKLRVPTELLVQVDASVAKRRPAPSRHQWILEAIYEKLEREEVG